MVETDPCVRKESWPGDRIILDKAIAKPARARITEILKARAGFSNEQGYMERIAVTTSMSERILSEEPGLTRRRSREIKTSPTEAERRRIKSLRFVPAWFFARSKIRKENNSKSNENAITTFISYSFSSYIIVQASIYERKKPPALTCRGFFTKKDKKERKLGFLILYRIESLPVNACH